MERGPHCGTMSICQVQTNLPMETASMLFMVPKVGPFVPRLAMV